MDFQFIGDCLSQFFGLALVGSGLYGVVSPLNMNKAFGVPKATAETAFMYPAVGARNLAAGLAVLILSLTGQRKVLGMFFLCWAFPVGLTDTSICLKTKTKRADHLINVVAMSSTGLLALQNIQGSYQSAIMLSLAFTAASVVKTLIA